MEQSGTQALDPDTLQGSKRKMNWGRGKQLKKCADVESGTIGREGAKCHISSSLKQYKGRPARNNSVYNCCCHHLARHGSKHLPEKNGTRTWTAQRNSRLFLQTSSNSSAEGKTAGKSVVQGALCPLQKYGNLSSSSLFFSRYPL